MYMAQAVALRGHGLNFCDGEKDFYNRMTLY